MKRVVLFSTLLLLAAAPARPAADPPATADPGAASSLRMEELEVRGLREKPGTLYLPVHRGIDLPSPVRYDLFLEDAARPFDPEPPGGGK
jgi:hypothetical protein